MSTERFLITGAMGCIGAWATKLLLDDGADVAIFDLSTDDRRLRSIIDAESMSSIERISGDITDVDQVRDAAAGRTHIIHLAALQVPFCRANPTLGAAVNVTGTVNMFEAAKEHAITNIAYASSIAVYGHPRNYDFDILPPDAARLPETLYGVFKVANEDTAAIYWQDDEVPSIGIRPYTVYGPLRDQGGTAQPTLAIEAAVREEDYHIQYGGVAGFQFAPDVARMLTMAARTTPGGADVYSLTGDIVSISEFVDVVSDVTGFEGITHGDDPLPFPEGADDTPLRERLGDVPHTPLRDAIAATAAFFEDGTIGGEA
ncbi:MAG: NAD-dependent epimerase/dehydratase family protein [Acidimicrobiia bacterium]